MPSAEKIVEIARGTGEVQTQGQPICKVRYLISIRQKALDVRSFAGPGELEGLKPIDGRIEVLGGQETLFGKDDLTLHMEDGREADFVVLRQDAVRPIFDIKVSGNFRQTPR